jgi:hypothetical protein
MRHRPARIVSLLMALVTVSALVVAAAATAKSGHDNHPQKYAATLNPVPHDPTADGGSNVTAKAKLRLRANDLRVLVKAAGLSPGLPHAMHIHGKNAPELAQCPGANRRVGGVSDQLIETVDGLPDYGPIQVSFTVRGDTSPASALALDRFKKSERSGTLSYQRTIRIPPDVAGRLDEMHIVIHGDDINHNGTYDPTPITALGAPLEAELPVACGEIHVR